MKVGYVRVTLADGRRVLEHRQVWKAAHGPIPPDGIIHHRNGIKTDNRLENLELVSGLAEHQAQHGGSLRWGDGVNYCPRGHLKDGKFVTKDGKIRRYCLTCNRERSRRN